MIITMEIINKGRSRNGAWSSKQLKCLGTTAQNNPGWLSRLIGTEVDEYDVANFLILKDKHLDKKEKKKNNLYLRIKKLQKKIRRLQAENNTQAKRIQTLLSLERMEKAS